MSFNIVFTERAFQDMTDLENNPAYLKQLKAVKKTLGYLETNPRHPGLHTHKYTACSGKNGEGIFEAYAENNTPAAFRIFWHYGPTKNTITILTITSHP